MKKKFKKTNKQVFMAKKQRWTKENCRGEKMGTKEAKWKVKCVGSIAPVILQGRIQWRLDKREQHEKQHAKQ